MTGELANGLNRAQTTASAAPLAADRLPRELRGDLTEAGFPDRFMMTHF